MRLLVVEDEHHVNEAITNLLHKHNYIVDAVYDGFDGYHYIVSGLYDLVILNEKLPSMNGPKVVQKIRNEGLKTTILMLLEDVQDRDNIQDLDYGADDYLRKPFAIEELLERVRELSHRKDRQFEQTSKSIGDIVFNQQTKELFNGKCTVQLTPLENTLFQLLLSRHNKFTSKDAIIEKLWGSDAGVDDNNVEVYISYLRKKLRSISDNVIIKTTRNVGYSLVESDNP